MLVGSLRARGQAGCAVIIGRETRLQEHERQSINSLVITQAKKGVHVPKLLQPIQPQSRAPHSDRRSDRTIQRPLVFSLVDVASVGSRCPLECVVRDASLPAMLDSPTLNSCFVTSPLFACRMPNLARFSSPFEFESACPHFRQKRIPSSCSTQ
jgi:hypothetical protein